MDKKKLISFLISARSNTYAGDGGKVKPAFPGSTQLEIEWKKENFKYLCTPDFQAGIEKVAGLEEVYKDKEKVCYLFYTGGFIG